MRGVCILTIDLERLRELVEVARSWLCFEAALAAPRRARQRGSHDPRRHYLG